MVSWLDKIWDEVGFMGKRAAERRGAEGSWVKGRLYGADSGSPPDSVFGLGRYGGSLRVLLGTLNPKP